MGDALLDASAFFRQRFRVDVAIRGAVAHHFSDIDWAVHVGKRFPPRWYVGRKPDGVAPKQPNTIPRVDLEVEGHATYPRFLEQHLTHMRHNAFTTSLHL